MAKSRGIVKQFYSEIPLSLREKKKGGPYMQRYTHAEKPLDEVELYK